MITSIRREVRNLLRIAPNEAILDRIKEAESILDRANVDGELQTKVDHFVDILCESIKIKDVELSTLALQSLKRFIESEHVGAKSLQLISETVTKIEFTSTESELVEEGYHQAVRVCRSMVKCDLSHELTNGSISEIVIFCFRVVNSKLVKWLRSKAARTLMSITRTLFKRLKDFPEDPNLKPSFQIRLRLGGASSQSTFKELADQSFANDNSSPSTSSSLRIIKERNDPYNLAFINDFFCYLASLINPNHDQNDLTKAHEEKILLGLKLLKSAFDEASIYIGQKSSLIYITRNNICYNIVAILKTIRSLPLISSALHLASDIFIQLRHHLKYQFEAFLERIMEMLATNTEQSNLDGSYTPSHNVFNPAMELRTDVLNTVLELFRNIRHFPHELYYNYDCDPYSSNIYENLVQICSKNCFQHSLETHFTPIQLTSFKCLLTNLADIYGAEIGTNYYLTLGWKLNQTGDHSHPYDEDYYLTGYSNMKFDANKIRTRFPRTYRDLNEAKKRKRLLWLALDKFNARPKDGIQFIKDNKLINDNEDLVQFLKDNLRVDKKVLGEFLSKEDNRQLREAFIRSLDFTNLRIDEALRFMLEKFRLPGESQLIERILDTFSTHWFEQNKGILQNSDNALSLAYAIIMLNVDQHSKKVKPMTCDEFDRNLLGPKSERIYDRKLLDLIYTSIRDDEIVLPDEQVGAVRQRYLWKCTMVKSDRIDALYWITGKHDNGSDVDQHKQRHPVHISRRPQQQQHKQSISQSTSAQLMVDQPPGVVGSPNDHDYEHNNNISNNNVHSYGSQSLPTSATTIPCDLASSAPAPPIVRQADETNQLPDATVLVISEPACAIVSDTKGDDLYPPPPPGGDHRDQLHTELPFGPEDYGGQIRELALVEMNKILFEIMWSPTIAALSFIFDKMDTSVYAELSRQIVDQGFIKFAHLCAQHGHLDNLVVSLCKFTTDLSPIPHTNHSGQGHHLMSDKNSLAALSLLSIIRDYANCMRESWSNIIRNILQWYCSKCIDDVVQVDDFALQRKFTLRMREIKKSPSTMNQQSSTFLRSVYTYFAGQQPNNEGGRVANGGALGAPSAIQVLIQTIQDAEYCQESLVELISALTTTSIDGDTEEIEDAEVFKLEIFTQVILNNKDQASGVWPRIRAYFARQSSICGRSSWLGERIISAAFRVAIQFKPKPEVFSLLSHIITTLDAEIVRGDHTFVALMTLAELHAPNVSMDVVELEACFYQVIFPFLDKVLDGCDPVQADRTLNRAINLLSKIFLKHHKILKSLQAFPSLWGAILDTMGRYIKANEALREATFELVKNMVLVMDNEQCMSVEMLDDTRTKFMLWGFQIGSDY